MKSVKSSVKDVKEVRRKRGGLGAFQVNRRISPLFQSMRSKRSEGGRDAIRQARSEEEMTVSKPGGNVDNGESGKRLSGPGINGEDSEDGNLREESEDKPVWEPCAHKWKQLDKEKLPDRIVFLQRCRKCNRVRSEEIGRRINNRRVFANRTVTYLAATYEPESASMDQERTKE